MISITFVSLLAFIVKLGTPIGHPHLKFGDEYSYNVRDPHKGPLAWRGTCQTGHHQSPIDLRYRDEGVDLGYTKMLFSKDYKKNQIGFYFANRGHTMQVQLNSEIREPFSTLGLSGAGLQGRYSFSQLHFHWGDRDEVGSEHTLQGQRYPLEIHFIHFKTKYGNLTSALNETDRDPEAVMVCAVLCELGTENEGLRPIVDAARVSTIRDPSNEIKRSYQRFNIFKILPQQLDFVRYFGSLTTPPCTEKVAWTVFTCPITISHNQLEAFRHLRNQKGQEYYNYRPLQPKSGRRIKFYKVPNETSDSQSHGQGQAPSTLKQNVSQTVTEINFLVSKLSTLLTEVKQCSGNIDADNLLDAIN